LENAPHEIEKYLKLGAVMIGEQKFGVDCDAPVMQRLYALAADYDVPILMHWQFKSYNYGFDRFHRMLAKFPRTKFIGHAPTWWAHIDKNYVDDENNLYPKGPVTPGGLTERYLSDYPNMFGDLSAGSGRNAFARNQDGRMFIDRFQDKLLFGSDCIDSVGRGGFCTGWVQLTQVRALAPSKAVERKILFENAKRMLRI
jgi:predicted TIM-barrel fold metal-dependent hydrolase